MSDALSYLLKARPEAMGHYFRFLKDAGSRLEPKTRSLISVITKVHSQTERGLLQYTKRALGDGASAEEILDALLMAFPALGLAKIVWADLKSQNSAPCRKCHSFAAMALDKQSREAAKHHSPEYIARTHKTCIDCHKGVAHELPQEM